MWFHKKKAPEQTPEALPRMPPFPVSLPPLPQQAREPLQEHPTSYAPVMPPLQREQEPEPRLQPRELPKIEMPRVDILPAAQPAPEIPQREPSFLHRRTYPQREAVAAGRTPSFEEAAPREELNEHWPPQRAPQGLAFQEQQQEQRYQPSFTPQEQGFHESRPSSQNFRQPLPPLQPPPQERTANHAQETKNFERQRQAQEERPVFVKLEDYREVMASIDLLKQKIKETEYLIERIEEMRTQEQVELENCHDNLNKLKENLITIDKKLFEV